MLSHQPYNPNFNTDWEVIIWVTDLIRIKLKHHELIYCPDCVTTTSSPPLFTFDIVKKYVYPLFEMLCNFHDALIWHQSNKIQVHNTQTKRSLSQSSYLANLPDDIWAILSPQLSICDWYCLSRTCKDLNVKMNHIRHMDDVQFTEPSSNIKSSHAYRCDKPPMLHNNQKFNISINQNTLFMLCYGKWYDYEFSIKFDNTANINNCTTDTNKYSIIKYETGFKRYHEHATISWRHGTLDDNKTVDYSLHLTSVDISNRSNPDRFKYYPGIYWVFTARQGFTYCTPFECSFANLEWDEKLAIDKPFLSCCSIFRIELNPYCGSITLCNILCEDYVIDSIQKKHINTCECQIAMKQLDNYPRRYYQKTCCQNFTDTIYPIGKQDRDLSADGVFITKLAKQSSKFREKETKHIPMADLYSHPISSLSWFWPWYNYNDVSMLSSFRSQDLTHGLDVQMVVAQRKIYNYQYHFEPIFH